jgi:putative ABC transport system permease protein
MFINYLKIALRNFIKQKGYTFINIFGLAIGMAISIFILLWVRDELSFDRFHKNSHDIYRVILDEGKASPKHEAVSPAPLAAAMKEEYPDVLKSTRIIPWQRVLLTFKKKQFQEGCALVDADFFAVFDFPFIKGNRKTAFKNKNSIIISRRLAKKIFINEDPMGKVLNVNNRDDFIVTGIIENVPHNSHLTFDFLIPFSKLKDWARASIDHWGNISYFTYLLLAEDAKIPEVNRKLNECVSKHNARDQNRYYLQPLTRIHLYSDFNFDMGGHGDIQYVYIFFIVAIFILLLACINFMNLATARAINREKEIGMRKVVGARKKDIIKQFYGESFLMVIAALFIAVIMVELFFPVFNNLIGKQLTIDYFDPKIAAGLILFVMLTAVTAGSYPAIYLSSFKPAAIFKSFKSTGTRGAAFRKILVILQFSLSIMFIIGTAVVYKQLQLIKHSHLGFDKENLIYLHMGNDLAKNYESIKNRLLQNPGVLGVSGSNYVPIYIGSGTSGADWEGKKPDERVQMQIIEVNHDFLETYKMEMAQGRFFSKEFSTDPAEAIIVNQAAVKAMGMESPLGKKFSHGGNYKIIGVIHDFHYKSLRMPVEPLIVKLDTQRSRYLSVRIKPGSIERIVKLLEKTWKKFRPNFPFEYHFLDETIENLYRAEKRMGEFFSYFALLAIIISCLGLFGLASFTAERRTREIGVRKTLGASVIAIMTLFSKEFAKWILLANIIAWPTAYIVMNKWLQNFVYRAAIGLDIFIFSALLALVIALLTVSYQSVRAALTNPVEALRYE